MWTAKNRGRYDRSKLRYPSDLSDEEWAHVEPLIPPAKRGGNRRPVDVRGQTLRLDQGSGARNRSSGAGPMAPSMALSSGPAILRNRVSGEASSALLPMPRRWAIAA